MKSRVQYDPLKAPEPKEWLALGEQERIDVVQDYHRRARVRLPNEKLHAVMHAVIENQIALGDETPVQSTAQRLMAEGLDRHDAIHAIGSVLSGFIFDIMTKPVSGTEPNELYFAELRQLTAKAWLDS
jgi:hypothetical protein